MTRDPQTVLLDPASSEPLTGEGGQQTVAPRRNAAMLALRSLVRSRVAFLAALFIVALVLSAIFAPYLAPHEPHTMSLTHRVLWPAWTDAASNPAYLFGTDGLGRDILSRLLYATRMTLVVAVSAVLLSGFIGILLGLVTGYFGGWIDLLVMRLADLQLAFPSLLIGLIVMALIGVRDRVAGYHPHPACSQEDWAAIYINGTN